MPHNDPFRMTKPVRIKLLQQAWNFFARLLDIDWAEAFMCPVAICGPSPDTIIFAHFTGVSRCKNLKFNDVEHNVCMCNSEIESEREGIHVMILI